MPETAARRAGGPAEPIGPGALALVVGPSGAGKDTLIEYARRRLQSEPGLHFARRIITREPQPEAEDHDAVSPETFQSMLADSLFALHWHAHGLFYGVPASIDTRVAKGDVVVANVSRSVVGLARRHYARVVAVHVSAPPAVLARRLSTRRRESSETIAGRLSRGSAFDIATAIEIVNDGPVEQAGEAFIRILLDEIRRAPDPMREGSAADRRTPFAVREPG